MRLTARSQPPGRTGSKGRDAFFSRRNNCVFYDFCCSFFWGARESFEDLSIFSTASAEYVGDRD